jgi:cyclophilin family peptidyl-prolyl cis-trans isomerase
MRSPRPVGSRGTTESGSSQGSASGTAAPAAPSSSAVRPGSRAANRAVKRATSPRPVQRGRVQGRSSTGTLALLAAGAASAIIAVILVVNPFGGAPAATGSPEPSSTALGYGDGTCPTSQPASLGASDVKTVTIETDQGTIVMEIDGALAPIATGNFVALAKCHFYDGLTFHRLVPGFVIQGGDPAGDGSGGPGYTIKDDPVKTTYHRGTVAMARTPEPDSQGSQFFIVLSDDANTALSGANPGYAILGQVTSGMDVIDKIQVGDTMRSLDVSAS